MPKVSAETSCEDAPSVPLPLPPGVTPADLVAELAGELSERDGDEYLVYERDGEWALACGARTLVELDTDELRVTTDGVVQRQAWSGRPGLALGEAVDRLLLEADRVYGWVAFEFGAYRFGLQQRLRPGTPLARIFLPRTEFLVTASEVRVTGADDHQVGVLQRLLASGVPPACAVRPVEVHTDTAEYRDRVTTAID
ncbi:MAG TPA: salicylate synthase, partial [Mycobacterium sp.]|nr:salicylate synthase [Mycobacterium sp.]